MNALGSPQRQQEKVPNLNTHFPPCSQAASVVAVSPYEQHPVPVRCRFGLHSVSLPASLSHPLSIPNRLSYISRLSSSNSMFGGFGREKLNYDDQSNCTLLTHHVSVRHIEVGLQSSYCGQHKIKDK